MNTIQTLVHRYATAKFILILFFLTQAVYLLMLGYTIPQLNEYTGDMQIFDLRPQGYSADYAKELLTTFGEDGRRIYMTRQMPLDFIYPGLFMVTYALLLNYIFKRAFAESNALQWLIVVPLLAGVFDYLENIAVIAMLTMYPDFSRTVAQVSSVFSVSKSILTSVMFILLCVGLAKWLFKAVGFPASDL